MASWNGNCYCEENPKSYPCQTYTDMEGYVNWMWHDPDVIPQILSCPQDIYDRAYVNAQGLQNGIEREIFSTSVFTIRTYNSGTFCDEFNLEMETSAEYITLDGFTLTIAPFTRDHIGK